MPQNNMIIDKGNWSGESVQIAWGDNWLEIEGYGRFGIEERGTGFVLLGDDDDEIVTAYHQGNGTNRDYWVASDDFSNGIQREHPDMHTAMAQIVCNVV